MTDTRSVLTGLTSSQAAERLARDGPNELPQPRPPPPWRVLLGQMANFFALMLWGAAALAALGGLPELALAIVGVVVLNGVFSFVQERRSERAAARLRDLLPTRVTVIRDGGHQDVSARELVVDDLVVLDAGSRISADLRCVVSHALLVDVSSLTGESVPERVSESDALWAGTFVVEGEGLATITSTGSHTRLAGIAELARHSPRPPSPLARELHRLVRTVAAIAGACGLAFFGLTFLLGTPPRDGFLLAVGITVALVPEGLLPTVTLSLAIGAQRMARQNALVRHLEAVETLGSTTFICTDKTGTLTRNEMTVVEVWTPAGTVAVDGLGYGPEAEVRAQSEAALVAGRAAARSGALCSNGHAVEREGTWEIQGDPMEAALDVLARRLEVPVRQAERYAIRRRLPFDPRRRRMSVIADGRVITKGAPDAVLPVCRPVPLAEEELTRLSGRGLRVLAVASRPTTEDPETWETAERDLELLALVGFEDPPRAEARSALEQCRRAGVRVAMVTGDHPATATAIAREVGLLHEGSPVLVGDDLPDDEQLLGAMIDHDGAVIARVSPEDKLRMARALRARGHVIAMTGDGVNDGPALQHADIGVAMGRSGTDVAREASDLVLLDDDFATIVVAIAQGRAAFANVRRFLTYHLTDNVAELTPFAVWAVTGGTFPLALGVLQILALDLGTDTLPAVALGAEPPSDRVLDDQPASGRIFDRRVAFRVFGVLGPAEAVVEMAAFTLVLLASGWVFGDPEPAAATLATASGAAFLAVVAGQTANAFACRSTTRPLGGGGLRRNRLLVGAAVTEAVVGLGFLFAGPIARLLDHRPPSTLGWAVALMAAPTLLCADAAHKQMRRRRARDQASPAGRTTTTGTPA